MAPVPRRLVGKTARAMDPQRGQWILTAKSSPSSSDLINNAFNLRRSARFRTASVTHEPLPLSRFLPGPFRSSRLRLQVSMTKET